MSLIALLCAIAPVSFAPRVETTARLDPGNHILAGAGQDVGSFGAYSRCFPEGRRPVIYMTYIGLCHPDAEISRWGSQLRAELRDAGPASIIPQIGLSLVTGKDTGAGADAEVAAGKYDSQIEAFADAVSALKRPVFLRVGYEFDGSWNNYQPATFVAAWRRITERLRARNLPVATVWCTGGGSAGWSSAARLAAFYPGDDEVDWWGVDLFSPEELTDFRLGMFLDGARTHRKPVMLAETTPRHVGATRGAESWNRWYAPMLAVLRSRPEIKAFDYIDWDWAAWSAKLGFHWEDWGDARVEDQPAIRDRWVAALTDPIFIGAKR